ncbi:hypothetical protein [Rhodovulum sp. BSW8]|uniref:hypothetical protein n=1 Tax=Rhodovulum sp. BSW8 TaxID=2259645 RepID=UPI001058A52A|nr:hypothetical protein [Rhodovulum sp. BSW8]
MIEKKAFYAVGALVALPYTAIAQDSSQVQRTLSFGTTVATFDEDGGESGRQIFAPLQFTYSTQRWDLGLKTAFIDSERESDFSGGSGRVTSLTDTAVSGTYRAYAGNPTWLQGRRATLAINADINLPTGQSQLAGDEKNAVFDSFIVDQDRFGEGLNVGIGFSSTITLSEQTLLGFGASYISRGDYNPDGDAPDQKLDPGDQIVGSIQLLHTAAMYQVNAGYRIIEEEETEVNGDAIYDRATSHEFFLYGSYRVNDLWTVRGSALYATRGSDELFDVTTGKLEEADEDDNGDTYYLSLGVSRNLTSRDRIGLDVSYRRQAENDFDEESFSFAPSLTRREIKVSYDRLLRDGVTLNASVAYFDVEEGDILDFDGPRFEGAQVSLGVSYAF